MSTMTSKKNPVIYSGPGSAISNYFSDAPTDGRQWGAFDKSNRQHMQILSLVRQLQWTTQHPVHGQVADLQALGTWLASDRSPVRKPLLDQDPAELSKIISALSGIVKSKFK